MLTIEKTVVALSVTCGWMLAAGSAFAGTHPLNDAIYADAVSYWNFDEGTGNIAYDSTSARDATLYRSSNWVDGVSGTAVETDWVDNGYLGHTPLIYANTQPWTWAMWQKTSRLDWNGIIGSVSQWNGTPGYPHVGYFLWHSTGKLTIYFQTSPTTLLYFNDVVLGSEAPINEWFHVAVACETNSDGTVDLHAYIDGTHEQTHTSVTLSDNKWRFHEIGNDWRKFAGQMDEVAIWDRTLTADEIEKLPLVAVPVPSTMLMISVGVVALLVTRRKKLRSD